MKEFDLFVIGWISALLFVSFLLFYLFGIIIYSISLIIAILIYFIDKRSGE